MTLSNQHFVELIRAQDTMAKSYGYVPDCKIVATLSQQLSFKYRLHLAIAQAQDLKYMRQWFKFWSASSPIGQQVVAQSP